jgi:hypothetical protein
VTSRLGSRRKSVPASCGYPNWHELTVIRLNRWDYRINATEQSTPIYDWSRSPIYHIVGWRIIPKPAPLYCPTCLTFYDASRNFRI